MFQLPPLISTNNNNLRKVLKRTADDDQFPYDSLDVSNAIICIRTVYRVACKRKFLANRTYLPSSTIQVRFRCDEMKLSRCRVCTYSAEVVRCKRLFNSRLNFIAKHAPHWRRIRVCVRMAVPQRTTYV